LSGAEKCLKEKIAIKSKKGEDVNTIKLVLLGLLLFLVVFTLAAIVALFIGGLIQTLIGFESKVFVGNFAIVVGVISGIYALYRK